MHLIVDYYTQIKYNLFMNIKKYLPEKKTPKTKHVQVRLTDEDFNALTVALESTGLSFQDFLEASCKAYTEESKRKNLR